MKKNTSTALGIIIIGCIALVAKLADAIGAVGILLLIGSGAGLWLFQKVYAVHNFIAQYDSDEFGPLFANPSEASSFYRQLMKQKPLLAERLREQQILRESLQIATSSKKKDIAESRMELAKEKYHKITSLYRIPNNERQRLDTKYAELLGQYSTVRYINEAQGHLDRFEKVKTDKTKKKYADLARKVIEKGLMDPAADQALLQERLKKVP